MHFGVVLFTFFCFALFIPSDTLSLYTSHQLEQHGRMQARPQGSIKVEIYVYYKCVHYKKYGQNTLHTYMDMVPVWAQLVWDTVWAGQCRVGHCRCELVSLCPAINRCHLTVQSTRGQAEQPAGYQGRSLLSMEAANRISDQ